MIIRKGLGRGKGKGYYNLPQTFAFDRKRHQLAGKGIKSPQKIPSYYDINPSFIKYNNKKLQEGTIKEHIEHPKLTMTQARQIAKDHLIQDSKYYGKCGGKLSSKYTFQDFKAQMIIFLKKYKRSPNFSKLPPNEQKRIINLEKKIKTTKTINEFKTLLKEEAPILIGILGLFSAITLLKSKQTKDLLYLLMLFESLIGTAIGMTGTKLSLLKTEMKKTKKYVNKYLPHLPDKEKEDLAVRLARYNVFQKSGKKNSQIHKR